MELRNKVVLVTGAGSGLGRAVGKRLHASGTRVLLVDLASSGVDRVVAELGDHAAYYAADVTSEEAVAGAVAAASALGELRGVVNCAGVAPAARLVGRRGVHDLATFRRTIEVNLIGTFNVMRLAAEAISALPLRGEERGVIINTASVAAFDGQVGQVAYSASKAAVAGMTLPAARDLAEHHIRVVTIAPGTFDTAMLDGLPEETKVGLARDVPHPHRIGAPDEFALLVQHIFGNPYLNGDVIRLDGALRMPPR